MVDPRRIRLVARTDIREDLLNRRLHLLVGTFGLSGLAFGSLLGDGLGETLLGVGALLVPLVALVFTHHAIAGRRVRDELVVVLSLPFSRREVVVGTFLGRTAVVLVGVVSLYAGGILGAVVAGRALEADLLLGGFLFGAVVGVVFVSIALGISAAAPSTALASTGSFVAYLVFVFQLWALLSEVVLYVLGGFESPDTTPTWAEAFGELSPFAALQNALAPAFDGGDPVPLAGAVPSDPPLYMEPWFGALVVLVWVVLPVALGYQAFARADL